jgi:hypothetical protein
VGARRLIAVFAAAACGPRSEPVAPAPPTTWAAMSERVVADFARSVEASQDAYVDLFDFVAVGEFEILLHRYDLNGRLPNLPDDLKLLFELEDGTPYPPEREKRNVGNFYGFLAQRTVGSGGCTASEPRTRYAKLLGVPFEPLPPDTPEDYEKLRTTVNAYLAKGGVVRITCSGGKGGLALVWTEKPNARGYDLITIYDD